MAAFYGIWHGPNGLTNIATRINHMTHILHDTVSSLGYSVVTNKDSAFDTVVIDVGKDSIGVDKICAAFEKENINVGVINSHTINVSLNETTTLAELEKVLSVFAALKGQTASVSFEESKYEGLKSELKRTSKFMTHEVFNQINSETEMLRYIQKLADKDVGLTKSMIPLGSCTMKLNATVEMIPVTWPEFSDMHPFAPKHQTEGYTQVIKELSEYLMACTGFEAISMQPNSGANGEYAGLLTIRNYHVSRGDIHRNVCLIPKSAHGTNPASASL